MQAWIQTNEDGYIVASTTHEEFSEGMTETELPDDFDFDAQNEYRFADGELAHDPPEPSEEELAWQEEAERRAQIDVAIPVLLCAAAPNMDDEQLVSVALLAPKWEPGVKRKKGDVCQHDGTLYRVTDNVNKNNAAAPGTDEGSGYYAAVTVAESGYPAWDPESSYSKGERVEHGGKIYESVKNNNTEEPGTGSRWEEVSE